ncbi:hypothetical protein [Litoreibacter ponti]|uniref:hypothetical protein n=1 Tax=Litoreibacter ponti TaxID=1510457 RepID=UPI0011B255DC|nr:hypothetical protein [Litoreibacter ponti]
MALLITACSSSAPSHLPIPLLLPAQAIGSALENTAYSARRTAVKSHVTEHFATLDAEIIAGGGPLLTQAYDLARIKSSDRAQLAKTLAQDPNLRVDAEALTVSLMVHGP